MKHQKGFTLIETLVAIFILTLTVGGLISLAAQGYFSVRYSRNQVVADNLIEETIEYLHNSRDTAALQGVSWSQWLAQFNGDGCFQSNGCIVDPYSTENPVRACSATSTGTCDAITYYSNESNPLQYNALYGYTSSSYPLSLNLGTPTATSYVKTVTMSMEGSDQMVVTVEVTWLNGSASEHEIQSELLTNWKQ